MQKRARQNQKQHSRDLESEILKSDKSTDLANLPHESFKLPPTKRQKTTSANQQAIISQKMGKQQAKECLREIGKKNSADECLNLTSSPSISCHESQNNECDTFIQDSENLTNKTPSTSFSQPTQAKALPSKSKTQISTLKNSQLKQINETNHTSKAATNSKGIQLFTNLILDSIVLSSKSGSTMAECQTIDSKKSHHSENSSIFNEDHIVNDFNTTETLNKNQANKIQSKKPVIKQIQKQIERTRKQNNSCDFSSEERLVLLFQAIDIMNYEHWKNDTLKSQGYMIQEDHDYPMNDISKEISQCNDVSANADDNGNADIIPNNLSFTQNFIEGSDINFTSPIMINPQNPIKDPSNIISTLTNTLVTKKRIRMCANRFCCSPNKNSGDYKNWSRRKVNKSNQFMWLCELCSLAYKNNQFCTYCIQIYLDSGDYAETDGKEWVQCESCSKWEHTECEVASGFIDLPQKLQLDPSEGWKYLCPGCRTKKSTNSSAEKDKPKTASSATSEDNHNSNIKNDDSFSLPQAQQKFESIENKKVDLSPDDFDQMLSDLTSTQKQTNYLGGSRRINRQKSFIEETKQKNQLIDQLSGDKGQNVAATTRNSLKMRRKATKDDKLLSCKQDLGKMTPTPQSDSFQQFLNRSQITTRHGKSTATGVKKL
ncbi:UNKNOWN [Stylonychia lemnae]|uniref:PHD-type domain-containing protein n=1 Tax=Stylonychia lemnae TaxID=5949 RepID=A0A078B4S0_STYLE|nr:UNKNOWN [Stylonychia lemnae]|eukprot:CDW88518.1 UNKNOWN [Stylonychia lemnae]